MYCLNEINNNGIACTMYSCTRDVHCTYLVETDCDYKRSHVCLCGGYACLNM